MEGSNFHHANQGSADSLPFREAQLVICHKHQHA